MNVVKLTHEGFLKIGSVLASYLDWFIILTLRFCKIAIIFRLFQFIV